MPNGSSAWVGNDSKRRKGRGGLSAALSILGLCIAFAVTGCGSVNNTGAPAAAEQQVATESIPTPDISTFDSPSPADVTSAPATHAAAPAPVHTTAAAAKPSLCGAPSNPFGYNFCERGGYIYSPASSVCSYFHCIANFYNGRGYMIECKDDTYSKSGGISGACSDHGGKQQPVYSG